MSRTVLVSVILFGALMGGVAAADTPAVNAKASLDLVAWLEGEWVRETKRGTVVESWTRVSDGTMEGISTMTANGVTRVAEYMRLESLGTEVFYTAKPNENPLPTSFKLVEFSKSRFVFENPDHDFPQRILYLRDGDAGMVARIEGLADGTERAIDFPFERRK